MVDNKKLLKGRARRAERYAILDKYRSQPCHDCGRYYPPYIMEFDHLDGTQKVEKVTSMASKMVSIPVLLAEIAKCHVVCSNCHKARSHKRNQFRRRKD